MTRSHHVSGNIGEVVQLSECEYDIKIRPDTNNNRHRLWFYFAVSNIRPQQQVRAVIIEELVACFSSLEKKQENLRKNWKRFTKIRNFILTQGKTSGMLAT